MAGGELTTTAEVSDAVGTWASKRLRVVAKPKLLYKTVAQMAEMPQGKGTTAKFRRYNALSLTGTALAPLAETVPPTGEAMVTSDVTATVQQWGNYVTLSDMVEYTVGDPVLRIANTRLATQAGGIVDALMRDVASAGTQVQYGGGVSARSNLQTTSHILAIGEVKSAVRLLQNNNSDYFARMITAKTGVGSSPIAESFIGVLHPDNYFDVGDDTGFVKVSEYSAQMDIHPGEVGYMNHVRFLSSTQCKVWAEGGGSLTGVQGSTNADVYGVMIFAPNAVGDVPLAARSMENIIHRRGSGGVADPIDQQATSGWKHTGARIILDDLFFTRIECTATA